MNGTIIYKKHLSPLGGLAQFSNLADLSAQNQQMAEIRVYGLQCYGALFNASSQPVRVEIRLIYTPNLNAFTDDAVDYLTPRFPQFFKSGKGVGNLLYQGYDRRSLGASDATGVPVKFKTLARKVVYLKSPIEVGTITQGTTTQTVVMSRPDHYTRFSLSHYFKNAKKHFIRGSQTYISDGNYHVVMWNSLSSTANSVKMLATTNLQWSLKAPMNADD